MESTPGTGTTFHIDLPVTGAAEETPAPITRPAPAPVSRQHILVVDDKASIRELLARELRSEGHEVDLAQDGEEGWARFKPGATTTSCWT